MSFPDPDLNQEQKYIIYADLYYYKLVGSITEYIVSKNISKSFYNFSDFFLKHRIDDDEVKLRLKTRVINSLKEKGYKLAYLFNKTGLLIVKSDEDLNNSVWKSNLDFCEL